MTPTDVQNVGKRSQRQGEHDKTSDYQFDVGADLEEAMQGERLTSGWLEPKGEL